MLSVEVVAEELECGPEQVIEELKAGVLPGLKFGRGWIIPRAAFIQTVNELALARMKERRLQAVPVGTGPQLVEKKKPGRPRLR